MLTVCAVSLAAAAGALLWSVWCAAYVLGVCLLLILFFWRLTKKRYLRLEELGGSLEEILYGNDGMDLVPDEEGELAVLSGRIYKMTVRLREQSEQLQREKIYLKDSLTDISHQVKVPLTSARLVMQSLRNPQLTAKERRELLAELERLSAKAEQLIEVLLKIARLESGSAQLESAELPMDKVVRKALEPLNILLDIRGIEVVTDLPEGVRFQGDLLWSAESVENVLKNCLEHTPDGGKLFITAADNPIFTELLIEDTGSGFAEEDIPHLFERFYKGKGGSAAGAGIGLALAAMIIRKQNGTIRAENRPKGGAKFRIRFYKGTV